MREIMDLLEDRELEVEFKWVDKNTSAIFEVEKHRIVINLEFMLAEALIHENIHDQYPELDESATRLRTLRKIQRLKKSEIQLIGKKLMDLWSTKEKK